MRPFTVWNTNKKEKTNLFEVKPILMGLKASGDMPKPGCPNTEGYPRISYIFI